MLMIASSSPGSSRGCRCSAPSFTQNATAATEPRSPRFRAGTRAVTDDGPVDRKCREGDHDLNETVVASRNHGADDVVVDEPARVGMVSRESSKPLLEVRERTIEADRDAHQGDCQSSQMRPDEASPSPSEKSANGNERQIADVHKNHEIGEQPICHRLDRTSDANRGGPWATAKYPAFPVLGRVTSSLGDRRSAAALRGAPSRRQEVVHLVLGDVGQWQSECAGDGTDVVLDESLGGLA